MARNPRAEGAGTNIALMPFIGFEILRHLLKGVLYLVKAKVSDLKRSRLSPGSRRSARCETPVIGLFLGILYALPASVRGWVVLALVAGGIWFGWAATHQPQDFRMPPPGPGGIEEPVSR